MLAAGNGYQTRTHANIPLTSASKPLPPWRRKAAADWRVQPDDRTQSFLELWLPVGAHEVEIEVTPPGRAPLPALRWGESRMWTDGQALPCRALIYPRSVARARTEHARCWRCRGPSEPAW